MDQIDRNLMAKILTRKPLGWMTPEFERWYTYRYDWELWRTPSDDFYSSVFEFLALKVNGLR